MAYGQWQIGLEIQEDGIRALAVVRRMRGLQLCRWWHLPLPEGCIVAGRIAKPDELTATLRQWRCELPFYHALRLAFPVSRTLTRQVAAPAAMLNEPECERYVAGAAARQLSIPASALALDYHPAPQDKGFIVTAAQQSELAQFTRCVKQARLNLVAVTPDASALCALLPRLGTPFRGIATWHRGKWLMACRTHWGWGEAPAVITFEQACGLLGLPANEVAWCSLPDNIHPSDSVAFDPWCALTHLQPPLPPDPAQWVIAIALTLGSVYL